MLNIFKKKVLELHNILIKNQFGFRKFHSSYMALMVMMNDISKALDDGDSVIGILLDFSKAFDTVNHRILLDKLFHNGVRGDALDLFESYLSDRRQYVTYKGYIIKGKRESVIPVFTEMRILKFPVINVYLTSRFMFRYHFELVPRIFHGYFTYNTDVHKYYTRQCAYFHIPVVKSELSKFSIRYRGALIWNEILKLGIDTATSEVVFIKSVKSRINDLKLCVS